VTHTCNPSYLGDRLGRSRFTASPGQIVPKTLSQKNSSQKKKAGGVSQGVGPEFKPQY
jgi:hypothetical protein